MPSSKGKEKAKVPAGSSGQSLAEEAPKPPAARLKVVGDLPLNKIWFPNDRKSLIDNPFELEENLDWTTHINDREEFDAEYSHYKEIWRNAGCNDLLEETFDEIRRSVPLDQCISLGLGNFARKTLVPVAGKRLPGETRPRKAGSRIRHLNPTLHQLMFIQRLVSFLEIPYSRVYLQDPGFTEFERNYLQNCFHKECILNLHEGEDRPAGAQDQLTPRTFLMAPMISGVLSEVLQPTHKAPGLYVGTQLLEMVNAKTPHLKREGTRALKAPFNVYSIKSSRKPMPRFIYEFEWPDKCEIRSTKLKK